MSDTSKPCFFTKSYSLDPSVKAGLDKIRLQAELHESGAASTPFTDRCRNLLDPTISKPLTVLVIAICAASRHSTLHILLGKDISSHLTRLATLGFEFIQFHFQERGFYIDDGRQRQIFDSQDSMLDHLRIIQSSSEQKKIDLVIGITLPSWQSGTNLIIAGNLEQLIRSTDVMVKLSGASDILILSGMDHSEVPARGQEVIELLCHSIPLAQALIIRKSSFVSSSHPAWLKMLQSPVIAPSSHAILAEDGDSSIVPEHPVLLENLARLHSPLCNYRAAREAMAIAAALGQQARSESERLAERRRMIEIPSSNSNDPGFRGLNEYVATNLQSDVTSLLRHIDDETRDSQLPGGKLFQLVKQVAEGLKSSQLTRSLLPKSTRFEAGEELCRSLRGKILEELVTAMATQKAFLEDALSASAEMIAAKLTETTGNFIEFKIPELQINRYLNFANSLAAAPMQMRIEIPRITGTQFAWTCFQNPTMILMSLTMPMGMFLSSPEMGPVLRKFKFDIALYGLVPIFLITPFYLHNKLRKEAEFNLEREMERLRNTLQTDLERMARTVSDERRKAAGEWLKFASDDIRKQAMAILSDIAKFEDKKRLDEKQSQQATLQRLDARLREFNQSAQLCDQLERDLRQAFGAITSNLRTALKS